MTQRCIACSQPAPDSETIDCYLCGAPFHFLGQRICGAAVPQTVGC